MRSRRALGEHRRAGGLYRDDLDIRILAFQIAAYAGNRSACADAGYKNIDLAVSRLPDLGTGGRQMRLRVCRIGELARNEAVLDLCSKLLCLCDRALHALCAVGQDDLRAVGFEQIPSLNAHGLGHGEDRAISSGSRDCRQSDSGVAAGRFDDDRAGLERAAFLCVVDHGKGDSVLDAASRIEILQLCVNICAQFVVSDIVIEFEQRRLANKVGDGFINFHDDYSCFRNIIKPTCFIGLL